MRIRIVALVAAILVLGEVSAFAYVVVLKDGSKIFARQKYEVKNGNAVITLENGNITQLSASQVDESATERYNKENSGNVIAIDAPSAKSLNTPQTNRPKRESLGDFIRTHNAQPDAPAPRTAQKPAAREPSAAAPAADAVLEREASRILEAAGVTHYRVFPGPRVTIVAAGEEEVFTGLTAAARLAVDLAGIGKGAMLIVEFTGADGSDGGRFHLTPDLVAPLTAGIETPSSFYVKNVIF